MSVGRWYVFTDGGSRANPGPAASAFCVFDEKGTLLHTQGRFLGTATNNEAEYDGFLTSLEWLLNVQQQTNAEAPREIVWKLDSKLVVEQLNRRWKIKEARLAAHAQHIWQLLKTLTIPWSITHVLRAENAAADAEVNRVLDAQT
jgi:ribonuclease HI